jgi:hypothetical protein
VHLQVWHVINYALGRSYSSEIIITPLSRGRSTIKIVLLGSQLSMFIGLRTCRPPLLARIHDHGTGASSRIVPSGEHSSLKYEDTRESGYRMRKSTLLDFQAGNSRLTSIGFQAPWPWIVSGMLISQVVTSTCHCTKYRGIKPLA